MKARLMKLAAVGMAAAMLLTGCGGKGETGAPAETPVQEEADADADAPADSESDPELEEYYELTMGSTTPSNNGIVPIIEAALDRIEEKTDGHVHIDFFPDSSIGTEQDMISQMQAGELDMLQTGLLAKLVINDYGFLTGYWWMKDEDHFWNVWNSEIGERYLDVMENDYNIHQFGQTLLGMHNIVSKKPVESIDDFEGLQLRMSSNVAAVDLWNTLGVNVNIMGWSEVMPSLQNGVIDTVEHTYLTFRDSSLWETTDYVIESNHEMDLSCFYANVDIWNGIPESYRTVIEEEMAAACAEYDTYRNEQMDTAKQELIDQGMTYSEISPEVRAEITEKLKPTFEKLFETVWTGATYEEVMSYAD